MGMSVTFYNCSSDVNVKDKVNTLLASYDCEVYDAQNIESPSFLLPNNPNIKNCNYVYVPSFGRYYTAEVKQLADGREIVKCLFTDVLTSFWESCKNSQCIANRSSSNYNREVDDNEVLVEPSMNYVYSNEIPTRSTHDYFTNNNQAYRIVLTVLGVDNAEH